MSPLALGQGEKHLRAEVEPIEDDKSTPEDFIEKPPLLCKQLRCGLHPDQSVLRRVLRKPLLDGTAKIYVTAQYEGDPLGQDRGLCVLSPEESVLARRGKLFKHFAALGCDEALNGTTFQFCESILDVAFEIRCVFTKPAKSFRLLRFVLFF